MIQTLPEANQCLGLARDFKILFLTRTANQGKIKTSYSQGWLVLTLWACSLWKLTAAWIKSQALASPLPPICQDSWHHHQESGQGLLLPLVFVSAPSRGREPATSAPGPRAQREGSTGLSGRSTGSVEEISEAKLKVSGNLGPHLSCHGCLRHYNIWSKSKAKRKTLWRGVRQERGRQRAEGGWKVGKFSSRSSGFCSPSSHTHPAPFTLLHIPLPPNLRHIIQIGCGHC